MANTNIQLKKSGESGNTPSGLAHGELAINYADGKLFYKNNLNNIDYITNQYTFGTIEANSTLVLASSPTDILTLIPSTGISMNADGITKTITLSVNESQLGTLVRKSGDTMTGDLNIETANVHANNVIVNQTLYSGLATTLATPLPNVIAQFTSNSSTYIQVNTQNIDANGSADFVVTADVGNDTEFYIDYGLLNSQYDNTNPNNSLGNCAFPLDGYLYVQGSSINQLGGNLIIGTTHSATETRIIAGGVNQGNVVVTFGEAQTTVKNNLEVTGFATVNTNSSITSTALTTNDTSQRIVDSFRHVDYRSAKYEVQITSGTEYHVIELRVLHDGSSVYMAQYGEMVTNTSLGVFDAEISGNFLNLLFTPVNSTTTVKLIKSMIKV